MSLVLVFDRDDPARVRFAISPLWETMAALRVLLEPQRHSYHLPWLDAVRTDLDQLDLWPLLALSPRIGWTPDFLTPAPAGPRTDVTDQLAQVRATPPEQVAQELSHSLAERSGEPAPTAAWRLLDDPLATRTRLADLLEQCWQLLIAPHWPRLRDLLQADMLYRTQMEGDYGLERVLSELHPQARWTGDSLVIDVPATEQRQLHGAGLLLMPSVFAWPGLTAIIDPPARPAYLPRQGNRRAVAARPDNSLPRARPPARPDPGRPAGLTRRTSLHPHPGPAARACAQHHLRAPGHPPSRTADHPQTPPPQRPLPADPPRNQPRQRQPANPVKDTPLAMSSSPIPQQRRTSRSSRARS